MCGFGFLFELLEDYYPPPGAGLLACDRDGRILSAGRGVFELTGFSEAQLMGKDLRDALTLTGENGKDPVATTLEWGVRQMAQPMTLRSHAGLTKKVVGDFFPAYDDDGGLLLVLTPQK